MIYELVMKTPAIVLIKDTCGPSEKSITNAAEQVVHDLLQGIGAKDQRFFYVDTQGELGELVHDGETFKGFMYT